MKILAIRPTLEEEKFLQRLCRRKHWGLTVTHRFGRPSGDYPVQKVLRMVRRGSSVSAVAEKTGIDRRNIYRILADAGISTKKDGVIVKR